MNKYKAQAKYDKENTIRVVIKLNKKTDADIIEWIEKQYNKSGSIKTTIREHLKR